MTTLSFTEIMNLEKYYKASLINKISGLRSANLIGTANLEGVTNLAIFNSVTHIGATPPLLGIVMRPLTVERHTYDNIKSLGYFTINQVNEAIHERAHQTSAKYHKGTSEFDECRLTPKFTVDFPAPFVAESKIQIGLSYKEEYHIKANNTVLLIGQIEKLILPDGVITEDGDLDLAALETVAVGGLDTYYSCNRLGRYRYARAGVATKKI